MSTLARHVYGSIDAATSQTVNYNSGGTLITGPALSSPLDASYGHLLCVRSYASGSVDPSVNTPSGWTKIAELTSTAGGYTVKNTFFTLRGDSTMNSVTITSANACAYRTLLLAVNGITADTFWQTPVTSSSNSNLTSRAPASQNSAYDNMVAVSACGLSGTAGAGSPNGFSFTNSMTTLKGTSQYDSLGVAWKALATAGTAFSSTISWNTSTLSGAAAILLGSPAELDPPTNLTWNGSALSWSAVSGAASYSIEKNGTIVATGITATTWTDTSASAGVGNRYRVQSVA